MWSNTHGHHDRPAPHDALVAVDSGHDTTDADERDEKLLMYDQSTWSRLARLKARKIYQEMQAEGLDRDDLPRKLREVAEREEAAIQRLSLYYGIEALEARLLLQLSLGDEDVAEVACGQLSRGDSIQHAIAVITMLTGEEYQAGKGWANR
jgi:hypothetical protein